MKSSQTLRPGCVEYFLQAPTFLIFKCLPLHVITNSEIIKRNKREDGNMDTLLPTLWGSHQY